ncbi:MAG: hypothetical protein ACYTGZ_14415 [Planctomycetota bacterium]
MEGGKLYWRPPPHHKARFHSAPYGSPTTTKTIYWEGKRTAGDTDFIFEIGAEDTAGAPPQVPFKITFRSSTAWGQGHMGPVKESDNFNANAEHTVFIQLYVATGTYKIKLAPADAPAFEWEGNLEPALVDALKAESRLVLQAGFKNEAALKGYRMDNLVMREKK